MQLELESAEPESHLDTSRSQTDYEAQQRIIDSIRLTPVQLAALKQVRRCNTPCSG